MSESGELETASGDGLSDGEGVVEEPAMFEDPVDVAPRADQHVAAFRTFGGMVRRRDLPPSGMRDAVSAFHHESCVQGCHEGCTPGSDERQRQARRGSVNGGWFGRVCTTLHLHAPYVLTAPGHLFFWRFLSVSCVHLMFMSSSLLVSMWLSKQLQFSFSCSPLGRERLMEYRSDSIANMLSVLKKHLPSMVQS